MLNPPIAEEQLVRARRENDAELKRIAARRQVSKQALEVGDPLWNYLLLTHLPLALPSASDLDLFYTRYYWFQVLARTIKLTTGPDAGLEQQAFQILEHAPPDCDWQVIENLDRAAELTRPST